MVEITNIQRNVHGEGWKRGRIISEESKHKNRFSHLGTKHSDETKRLMSEKSSGKNNQAFGKHWWNNGKDCIFTIECPDGWIKGRI